MHILTNISRGKCNQEMKFDQLIGYHLRNIQPEVSYTKFGGETIPRPFFKKSKLTISLDQQLKVSYSLFLLNGDYQIILLKGYQIILKRSCGPLAFTSYRTFLKNKKEVWKQSPCLIFCMIFKEKYFSCYILLTDQILLSGCLREILDNICIVIVFNQVVTS